MYTKILRKVCISWPTLTESLVAHQLVAVVSESQIAHDTAPTRILNIAKLRVVVSISRNSSASVLPNKAQASRPLSFSFRDDSISEADASRVDAVL